MDFPCLDCSAEVRPRQHAISCDICGGWQHRTCNTGVTLNEYRDAVKNNTDLHFVCVRCLRRELEPEQDDNDIPLNESAPDDAPHDATALDDAQFQLDQLKRAKEWFIDGTFRIVPAPFTQLSSVHAFIQQDGAMKQFPLVFILMSRRQRKDYAEVFRAILDKCQDVLVQQCVLDFEKAAWLGIVDIMPDVSVRGCVFHWTQSVWRHVQDVGLATTYRQREGIHKFIRQLLALPFLPAGHIADVFQEMKTKATQPQLAQLMTYVLTQWIESTIFTPTSWSVYQHTIHTNNDVEGWHHRLNKLISDILLLHISLFSNLYLLLFNMSAAGT